MMQGRQRIKDIIATLTDTNDVDYQLRLKTLHNTLTLLLNEQYLCTVNWWNLMPPDDLLAKITLEEEKKVRLGTTSASLASKAVKEAREATERRLAALKHDDKGLKRKASEMIDIQTHRMRKKRKVEDDEEEEQEGRFEFDVISFFWAVD
jgi:hypothetical protein